MTLRAFVIIGGVLCGAMGLLAATLAVYSVVRNDSDGTIQFVGLTAYFLGAAVGARKYGTDKIRPQIVTDGGGTTFRPDRELDMPLRIAGAGLVISLLPALPFPVLVIAAVGLAAMGPRVRGSDAWAVGMYLRLTPEGVELRQWLRTQSCGWDQVASVTDGLARARRRTPSLIVFRTSDGKELWVWGRTFTRNGTALRDLVRFYWLHPEVRGELADGVAPRRLEERLVMVRAEERGRTVRRAGRR